MPAWQREDGPGNTICLHGKGRAAPGIQKDIRRGFVGAPGGRRGGQRDNRAAGQPGGEAHRVVGYGGDRWGSRAVGAAAGWRGNRTAGRGGCMGMVAAGI